MLHAKQGTVYNIMVATCENRVRTTCTICVMKSVFCKGQMEPILSPKYVCSFSVPWLTTVVRNAVEAGNNPLTAFSFLHSAVERER